MGARQARDSGRLKPWRHSHQGPARTHVTTISSGPPTDFPPDPGRSYQDVTSAAFEPGATTVAIGYENGNTYLWRIKTVLRR